MRCLRKYQMKSHPWLCRLLTLAALMMLGLTCYAGYQKADKDMIYLGILTVVLFLSAWISHRRNAQVYRMQDIHRYDLSMELRRQKSK